MFYFAFIVEEYFCKLWNSRLSLLKHIKGAIQLPSRVTPPVERSIVSLLSVPLKVMSLLSLVAFFFSLGF